VPWSEGTDSTDRKNWDYWNDIQKTKELVFTAKLDGEGSCLNEFGVFARSHAAPSDKPWSAYLRQKHALMVHDLRRDQVEIFGENLFATHSILYPKIEEHFHVFAVRHLDQWLSWEEVQWWASVFDMRTVPVLGTMLVEDLTEVKLKEHVQKLAEEPEVFGSYDIHEDKPCSREGIVFRNVDGYHVDAFVQNVYKIVRKSHVKTDEHWERHWNRAYLQHEVEAYAIKNGIPLSDADSYRETIRMLGHKR